MKITLEMDEGVYSTEMEGDDYNADELKEAFSRLLVSATFSPDVIDLAEGGCFKCEYKEEDETTK